jgi:hypothetical protein
MITMNVSNETRPVRIVSDTGRPFAVCTSLPVALSREEMAEVIGGIGWGAVARFALRGVFGGAVGVGVGLATEVVWHYYSEDIINFVDSVVNYQPPRIDMCRPTSR